MAHMQMDELLRISTSPLKITRNVSEAYITISFGKREHFTNTFPFTSCDNLVMGTIAAPYLRKTAEELRAMANELEDIAIWNEDHSTSKEDIEEAIFA